ncbi:MAG: hypothetical protein NDF56_03045 [archaeon GB-1845-036]|nr:hypothetical protein [Candidatus Culexmicrobium thermophilum]
MEAFSTTVPRDFLELEASTILEEYYEYYTRSLESLRVVGGVFSTFQKCLSLHSLNCNCADYLHGGSLHNTVSVW